MTPKIAGFVYFQQNQLIIDPSEKGLVVNTY